MGRLLTRGQPAAVRLVERAIQSDRPPHALLLVGPDGVGKTTLALDLAAGLLCLAPDPAARPCRTCAACRKVEHANHPDLHLLTPEGAGQQIRIGQVQQLAAELALLPLEGRFRFALIEKAQRLNDDAQNSLLKLLEEPPARVVIVLAADDTSRLLPTVISRCSQLRLGPVATDVVAEMLTATGATDAVQASALARLTGGRPGAALAFAGNGDALIAQGRSARLLLDLLGGDRRQRLAAQTELLQDGGLLAEVGMGSQKGTNGRDDDGSPSQAAAGRGRRATTARRASPAERRAAVAQLLSVWADVARDLAVAARGGRRELRQHELLEELVEAGERVDVTALTRFMLRLDALTRALDAYANPELVLDVLLLEWPAMTRAVR